MKVKYYGLFALILIAASAAYVLVVQVVALPRAVAAVDQHNDIRVPRLTPIPAEDIQRAERLLDKVEQLARPGEQRGPGRIDIRLLGYAAGDNDDTVYVPAPVTFSYRVTMAFVGERESACVIDGRLYREGARLPDGGRVARIAENAVLVQKKGASKWLRVPRVL